MEKSIQKPANKWKDAILSILTKYYPNSVQLQTIYSEIPDNLLTDYARESRTDTNEPHYHHWTRAYLELLKREGRVQHPKWGFWRCQP